MNFQETIVAISTPPGMGAIAIVRMSGNRSLEVLLKIFRPAREKSGSKVPYPGRVCLGGIYEHDELLDEVLVTWFKAPHSYTGEEVAEISSHGSPYIQERLVRLILSYGIRLAMPGEFTLRAFMHGRMDLAQAEAVADLIASSNRQQHNLALQQMRGGVSGKLKLLRKKLVEFASLIELELDFSQEDVQFADRSLLIHLMQEIRDELRSLIESFRLGNSMKKGIPVAITGKPNAGKSTLLNAILDEEKAIVSEIPGTTRDAIEDTIIIDDIPFRFIDTAGLRDVAKSIEALGIEKTFEKIAQASIVLYIFDAATTNIDETKEELAFLFGKLRDVLPAVTIEEKKFILVANKIDQLLEIPHHFSDYIEMDVVFISAKRHENLSSLTAALLRSVDKDALREQLVITNLRHYEALQNSLEAIEDAGNALSENLPADLASVDIRKALYHIGLITGEVTDDELLSSIFGRFCIGK